jgi:hypothetical protein
MAVAVAASPPLPVRVVMSMSRIALILVSLGCAEPTAVELRPVGPPMAAEAVGHNSYSVDVAGSSVYVRLSYVRGEESEPIHVFMRRVFASADSIGARRLVIDLRSVSGADARLLVPLVGGVAARDRFLRHGGLVVVVGHESFSPKQNAVTVLQRYAHPIVVDQPVGAGSVL